MIGSINPVRILTMMMLATLCACAASTVEVSGSYPSPTIQRIPLTLGVYYSDALRNYTYTERSQTGDDEYYVESGQTHMELFNTVLPAMFENVVLLDDPSQADAMGVDAVFMPNIDEFQLGMPQKTRLEAYEVWVQYNMRLTGTDGSYIADWVMTAYGNATVGGLSTAESGINDAAVAALRDLASNFSISFTAVPDVRDWLARRT